MASFHGLLATITTTAANGTHNCEEQLQSLAISHAIFQMAIPTQMWFEIRERTLSACEGKYEKTHITVLSIFLVNVNKNKSRFPSDIFE